MAKKFQPGCACCDSTPDPTPPCKDGQLICVRAYSLPGVCQYVEDNPGMTVDYESPTVALGGLPVTVYLTDSTRAELAVVGTCTTSDKGKCCVTVPPKLPDPTRAATVDGAGGGDSGGTMGIGAYQLTYAYKVADATPGLTAVAPLSNEFQVGVPEWLSYPALTLPRVNPSGGGTADGLLDPGWYAVSFQVLDREDGHTASLQASGPISSSSPAFYVEAGNIPRVTFPRWWTARPNADEIRVYIARATATPLLDDDNNPLFDEFGNPLYTFAYGTYRRFAVLSLGETTADVTVYPEFGEVAPVGNTIAKSIPHVTMPGPMPSGATDTLLWIRTRPGTSLSPYGTSREAEFDLPSLPSHVIAAPTINSTSWSQYKIRVGPPGGLEFDRCDYVDLRNSGTNCKKIIKDFAFCEIEATWTVLDFDTGAPIVDAQVGVNFFDAGQSGCGETDTGRLINNGDGTYTYVGASSIGASLSLLNCVQGEPGTGGLAASVSHPDYFSDLVCGDPAPCGIPRAVYAREIRLFKRAARGGNWVKQGGTVRVTPSSWSVEDNPFPGYPQYLKCDVRQCLEFCGSHCASPELQDQGECYGQCQNDCGRPPDDRSRRGDIINRTLYVTFSGAPLLLGSYSGSEITLYWDETSSDGGSYGQSEDPPTPSTSQIRWISGCLAASGAEGVMVHTFTTAFGQNYTWADFDNPIFYGSAYAAYVLGPQSLPSDLAEGVWFENYWGANCTDPTLEFCPDVGDPLGLSPFIVQHRCARKGYATDCRPCSELISVDPQLSTAYGPKSVNSEAGTNYLACASNGTNFVFEGCNGVNYSCPPSWAMWNDSDYVIKVSINPYAPITCCKLGIIPELNYCTGLGSESCPNDCQKWGFVLSE